MHEDFPHGDFSRSVKHDPTYSRVLFQQDRPIADADLNVMSALITRGMRQFFIDVIGAYGTAQTPRRHHPSQAEHAERANFAITVDETIIEDPKTEKKTVTGVVPTVGPGFYYVQGLRCDFDPDRTPERIDMSGGSAIGDVTVTDSQVLLSNVPHRAGGPRLQPPFLVYLKVWERDITALQDKDLRDPALNSRATDTTTRTQIVWQVIASRRMPSVTGTSADRAALETKGGPEAFVARWLKWEQERLQSSHATITLSGLRQYEPANNLLYRVEVVEGGNGDARFVWSRNNGCAQFQVQDVSGNTVTVGPAAGLVGAKPEKGQVVELLGQVPCAPGDARKTAAVDDVTQADRSDGHQRSWHITLDKQLPEVKKNDVVRLWDGQFCATDTVAASEKDVRGLLLDDDVRVGALIPQSSERKTSYVAGDHWLLTTRGCENLDIDSQPRVVEDHVAPLALVLTTSGGSVTTWDLRSTFYPSSMWTVWDRDAQRRHEVGEGPEDEDERKRKVSDPGSSTPEGTSQAR